ncbi:MAG TPA: NAD(P)-dependent oxidoreductase [Bacteroidales bacterium]|nr:NAD(P)-dependent oxidoreductase [Bacteroidales bacterium]
MKVLVATEKPFAPVAVSLIRNEVESAGHELVLLENYKKAEELYSAVSEADALIVRSDKVTSSVIEAAKKLRIVVRAGAGYDNLDLAACTAHKVVAMNTPGQNSNAVAELAFMLMLYHARRGFEGKSGTELRGKTIGIHAFGNVGKYVAETAKGFGMKIFAFDPFINSLEMERSGVHACSDISGFYSCCHYISLHLPANDNTRKSIGYDLLMKMPHNAVLVNTARKEIIDEAGLLRVFADRSDFSYLADGEPDCKDVLYEKYRDRCLFTSKKMGAQTEEANINAGVAAARQIVDYFRSGNEKFRVNN